jgi:spore maturation protein CgeB
MDDDALNNRLPTRIFPVGCEFLMPFLRDHAEFVAQAEEADLVLAMNNTSAGMLGALDGARRAGKPIAWWTIEDPNWLEHFLPQAARADHVFTSDEACIPRYRERLGHNRVHWLPLGCCPALHRPGQLEADTRDFVVSGNWYENQARRWSVGIVVDPLLKSGRTLGLFCYASFMWPEPYRRHWLGETHYLTTSEQYRRGRVILGLNNQRSGMDGRGQTFMTSMRTFEALACGKPFLSSHSDAYARLGLVHGEHMAWVDTPAAALSWGDRLLGPDGGRIGAAGRTLVLSRHTYFHRLRTIVGAVA